SRRPLSFSLLQVDHAPERWRDLLTAVEKAAADGLEMRAQVGSRPIGVLMGLQATLNPFLAHAAYRDVQSLPLAERVARLRQPEVRDAILGERTDEGFAAWMGQALNRTFELGDPPDYEPDPAQSDAARAGREGVDPFAFV